MKKILAILLLFGLLNAKIGSITLELSKKTLRVFVEGKFEYTIKKSETPPSLTIYIPNETYEGPKLLKEKGVTASITTREDGTYITILPSVKIKSYDDYWGAGYLVIILELEKMPSIKRAEKTVMKKETPQQKKPSKIEEKFFIYSSGAPKYLILKALSRLTGEFYPSLDTTKVFLRENSIGKGELLSKLGGSAQ